MAKWWRWKVGRWIPNSARSHLEGSVWVVSAVWGTHRVWIAVGCQWSVEQVTRRLNELDPILWDRFIRWDLPAMMSQPAR